jgi:hypothetical protein
MQRGEFANQKALIDYVEQNDLAYEYDAGAVRNCRGTHEPRRESGDALPEGHMLAEWEANAPLRAIGGLEGEAGGQTAFNVRQGRAQIVLKIATRAATRYHWASGKLWHLWGGPNIACGG